MADAQLQMIDKKIIESASIIHTTAFALSLQPARDVIIQALENAKNFNKTISVDWNFAPSIWKEDNGIKVFEILMKMNPIIKLSADDMERFIGNKAIEEYKNYLDKYTCKLICITCGKNGVWYKVENKNWIFKETIKVDEVKDTTGAGDAFWAGFICAYIDKLPVNNCIDNALKIAAKKIQTKGPLYNS
jgi:fructokinase